MNFSEIKELLNAGFTRDDILAIAGVGAAGQQTQPEQQAQPEQQTQPEQQAQPEQPANDNTMQALADTVAALSKTIKDMQLSNAKSAEGGKPKTITSADVVKSFFSA
ncbi:MAG: hypothetical protein VZR54_09740 [Ruminococcus sp.]|nr:hypothetical protein [Ruminococcus sp.]